MCLLIGCIIKKNKKKKNGESISKAPEHMEEKLLGQNLESVQQEEAGGRGGQQCVRHH